MGVPEIGTKNWNSQPRLVLSVAAVAAVAVEVTTVAAAVAMAW